ncbi:acyltransferase family protein [Seonamhaeicola sp. ML3]|uniref:acyltransferase family protein n=1 Tax=Seonamhaeicola sp. ML3 TaxID=2937786 RepID=UPI00200F5063|nr:acyltransferase [Seonamhaeicola sp. ML3]
MKKDKTIETLRGLAILLVVIGHVIGSAAEGGMQVDDDSLLRYIYYTFIDPVQMPLFTVLAGWVYALKPSKSEIKEFVIKKVFRLLIPMLVVGACYFIVQYYTPGTNRKSDLIDLWKLIIFPYTFYWYLYSLFFVFVLIAILDNIGKMKTISSWMLIFILSLMALLTRDLFIPMESLNYFSYLGTLYLLPSFILGVGLFRFKVLLENQLIKNICGLLLMGCVVVQQLSWFNIIDVVLLKDNFYGLLIGFSFTILLLRSKLEINWLIWIGGLSYSIYLFHGFGTAAGRIIPRSLDVNSTALIFVTSLALGLIVPIIIDKVLDRFKITRILFLGRR